MQINGYGLSFTGLRVNRNEVIEKCKNSKETKKEINSTFANFTPPVTSVWSSKFYTGLFFKDKEQEKEAMKLFDKYGINYKQSDEIDNYDGWGKQAWTETGMLPEKNNRKKVLF